MRYFAFTRDPEQRYWAVNSRGVTFHTPGHPDGVESNYASASGVMSQLGAGGRKIREIDAAQMEAIRAGWLITQGGAK